jgi:hypothetical protein
MMMCMFKGFYSTAGIEQNLADKDVKYTRPGKRVPLMPPFAANSGFSWKIFFVFANDMYFSNSSLSIQICDLNVCPTLNSSNFKS